MIIDTHCHLDFKDFDKDRPEVIRRAKDAGVGALINVGSTVENSIASVRLSDQYENVYASVGIHPHDASSYGEDALEALRSLAKNTPKVIAIGEVGLDYYRNLSPKDKQAECLAGFARLSKELDKPLIIHSRDAMKETVAILEKETGGRLRGVMHCFSGNAEELERCLGLGLYVSFTCNATFKKAGGLREVIRRAPIERVLLETDAPFMSPEGKRGTRNEPANLVFLAETLAGLYGLSGNDIARITTHNANSLFRLGIKETQKIVYPIRGALYLNITNRCTCDCVFCARSSSDFVKGHNLRLTGDPDLSEIMDQIEKAGRHKEAVFCGFGEPTLRLDIIKEVAKRLKLSGTKVRLVTNGHGNSIHSRSIARELKGIVDKVSVSLNTESSKTYEAICRPSIGNDAYQAVVRFVEECVDAGIETEITCIDMTGVDIEKCREFASKMGASFRVRKLGAVG
ncbi:MAG: TatD family hydrolase [Candidatus Omnitrophota bacterium]